MGYIESLYKTMVLTNKMGHRQDEQREHPFLAKTKPSQSNHKLTNMGAMYSHLVFAAPACINYCLSDDRQSIGYGQLASDRKKNSALHWTPAIWLQTSKGVTIPAAYLKRPGARQTILFSHGNGEDLGSSLLYAHELVRRLDANVFVYEYSSYSHSYRQDGSKITPSEAKTNADITAAYKYIRAQGVEPRNIVLFGRSLGSGPSCYLAAHEEVGGLALISGLASIIRVVAPWLKVTVPGDMFPNIDLMKKILCPVLSVHGQQDEIVPFSHAKALLDAAQVQSFAPFWHPQGKHNDVETVNWESLILYYKEFLFALQTNQLSPIAPKHAPAETFWKRTLSGCFSSFSSGAA